MPKTVWEDTKKLNAEALPSKLLGFNFDAEPVKGLAKLKTAGSDKIIAEMQKQIDAWKATK